MENNNNERWCAIFKAYNTKGQNINIPTVAWWGTTEQHKTEANGIALGAACKAKHVNVQCYEVIDGIETFRFSVTL